MKSDINNNVEQDHELGWPTDPEAEQHLIAGLLTDPRRFTEVRPIVLAADFNDELYADIYRAMVSLVDSGQPIDVEPVYHHVKSTRSGNLKGSEIGRILSPPWAAPETVVYYAHRVSEVSRRRQVIAALHDEQNEALRGKESIEETVKRTRDKLATAVATNVIELETASELAQKALASYEETTMSGMPTGYATIDATINGLQPSKFIVVGGSTSMGKTSLACGFANQVGVTQGLPVLFFSFEMPGTEIISRITAARAKVPHSVVTSPRKMNKEQRAIVVEEWNRVSTDKINVYHKDRLSTTDIEMIATRQQEKHGVRLIIVDYLQLIKPNNSKDQRYLQVGQIATDLKCLAVKLGIPIVALAQLSREASKGGRPQLHHLRESGTIENDADVVIFPYRPNYNSDDKYGDVESEEAELIIAKNRNGKTRVIKAWWYGAFMTFQEYDTVHDEPEVSDVSTWRWEG